MFAVNKHTKCTFCEFEWRKFVSGNETAYSLDFYIFGQCPFFDKIIALKKLELG